jgi:hypothetical protein
MLDLTNGENLLFRSARAKFPRAKQVAGLGNLLTSFAIRCGDFAFWGRMGIPGKVAVAVN